MHWRELGPRARSRREPHVVTADGRVVLLDESEGETCLELYRPASDDWVLGPLTERLQVGAALALDAHERALVIGGQAVSRGAGRGGHSLSQCLACDLDRMRWEPLPELTVARAWASALRLRDGSILVVGGQRWRAGSLIRSCELLEPGADRWRELPALPWARRRPQLVELGDGSVIAYGGRDAAAETPSCALLDPGRSRWRDAGFLVPQGERIEPLSAILPVRVLARTGGWIHQFELGQVERGAAGMLEPCGRPLPLPATALRHVAVTRFGDGLLALAHDGRRHAAWTLPLTEILAWSEGPEGLEDAPGPKPTSGPRWRELELPEGLGERPHPIVAGRNLLLLQRDPERSYYGTATAQTAVDDASLRGLLAAVHADPEAEGPWLVLADWLQSQGDPRGEQISLELTRERLRARADPPAAELAAIEAGLASLERPAPRWPIPRGRFSDEEVDRMHALLRRPVELGSDTGSQLDALLRGIAELAPEVFELEQRRGFVVGARVRELELPARLGERLPDPLALLLQAPTCALLREVVLDLDLDPRERPDDGEPDLGGFLRQLSRVVSAPPLASVILGPAELPSRFLATPQWSQGRVRGPRWEPPDSHHVGSTAPLACLAPHLRELQITGNEIEFEPLALPRLERLRLRTATMTSDSLLALETSKLPRLRELELWLGRSDRRLPPDPLTDALLRALPGRDAPRLERLAIHNAINIDSMLDALLGHGSVRRAEILDLSNNLMSDRGAHTLIEQRQRLAGIGELILTGNLIGRRAARELERLLGSRVVVGPQRSATRPRVF